MGKGKKRVPKAVTGGPKEKHKRKQQDRLDPKAPPPPGLLATARPAAPTVKSKHHSYFEFVENKKHKKKKLEFETTSDEEPPPGFTFVPISSVNLANACKELSREKDAMIWIVSQTGADKSKGLSHQINRTGYHIRWNIVEEAKTMIADMPDPLSDGLPEPIPKSQEQYTRQVNSAIKALFPNIPNTDREAIIVHGFNLGDRDNDKVGLNPAIPLHKRVQKAVLAHIRHMHTRYDELLKEVGWGNSRKITEQVCLDVLVKWRGDDENGQDQLDEILREVVVISDSDSDESDGEVEESDNSSPRRDHLPPAAQASQAQPVIPGLSRENFGMTNTYPTGFEARTEPVSAQSAPQPASGRRRKKQSGFKRYLQAWDDAVERSRGEIAQLSLHQGSTAGHGPQHVYADNPPSMSGLPGPTPMYNGFVALRAQAASAPYSPADSRRPHAQVTPAPYGQSQPSFEPARQSPAEPRLQDMLVRSIEPTSLNSFQPPAFVRSLPPRTPLSPVRRSIQYPPAPHEGDTRARPFYVGNNRPAESIGERMHEEPTPYGRSPFPVERSLLPSTLPVDNRGPQATYGTPAPAQRVAVGVGRPGGSSNPILMEDRGGFYERVHTQPPSAAHNATGRWHQDESHVPARVVTWEEGSRYMREAQNDRDIEIIPVPEPRDRQEWPPNSSAYGQPYHYRPTGPPGGPEALHGHRQPPHAPAPTYQQTSRPLYPQRHPQDHHGHSVHPPPAPGSDIIVLK